MRDVIHQGVDTPKILELFDFPFNGQAVCLWREVDGEPVGAFAYTGYGAGTVQMHYVGVHKYWMTRKFLRRAFTYPFQDLGVKVILAFLPSDKIYARDVAIKIGFKNFGQIPGVGIHMLTMVRDDCRWLEVAHG